MSTYFHRKVWIGFLAAVGLIALLAFYSYVENNRFAESSQWVAHTNSVLYHSAQVLSLTVDLEAGQRGFSLTGKEEFLDPVILASNEIESHIKTLFSLTADNPSQQARLKTLNAIVNDKLEFNAKVIETRRKNFGEAAALNATLTGKELTDQIRKVIEEIQVEENTLLKKRTALMEKRVQGFYTMFSSLLVVVAVILILVFYSIYITVKKRVVAEAALKQATEQIKDIYDNAPCGYHSLNDEGLILEINNTWLTWLQYSREEVIGKKKFSDLLTSESLERFRMNFEIFKRAGSINDLRFQVIRKDGSIFDVLLNAVAVYDSSGRYVQSRSTAFDYTAQAQSLHKIETLNKELESFSYSVSHDLRAPLRSIDGYTQILIDDYGKAMDDEGNRLLQVVAGNARRMGQLIDDLLDFSRVGRKELAKTTVSAQSLVNSIINDMKSEIETRDIRFEIGNLPPCQADLNLLRQVWFNLISNAVKYTRKRETAVVIITGEQQGEQQVYSIRDNGTGFDMRYAAKLFGVFQRLHRQQDFEGTGVGLAIVHRIISRHGGKVWAEGKLNEGAVFSFSLPHT